MRQRDARICTAKAGFFRSGDNSPSSGHVTRRSLLCHCFATTLQHSPATFSRSFVPQMRYFFSKYTKYSIEKISFWDAKLLAECSCRMLSCCLLLYGNISRSM